MGLRIKAGAINSSEKLLNEDFINSKYSKFESSFLFLLENLGINLACFLIKKEDNLIPAFPFGFNIDIFDKNIDFFKLTQVTDNFKNDIFYFEDFSLFKNFFIEDEYSKIKSITLYSVENDEPVFLLLIQTLECKKEISKEQIEQETKNFLPQYNSNKKIIKTCKCVYNGNGITSIESKLNGAYLYKSKTKLIKFSFEKIFGETEKISENLNFLRLFYSVVNKIISLIGKSNFTVLDNSLSLNACIFSVNPIDENLYIAQIEDMLSTIYGKEITKSLNIEFLETDNIEKELKLWLAKSYKPLYTK